jgi:formylglycine-generating enzyme required for sulfatase activity
MLPFHLGELTPEDQHELEALLQRFEEACRSGRSVNLADFVPMQGKLSLIALQELIKIDLEVQWRLREGTQLEDYLERFPELADCPRLWPGLLYEEYFVRQRYGDQPPLASYRDRFPNQYEVLERLVRERPRSVRGSGPGRVPLPAPPPFADVVGVPDRDGVLGPAEGYQLLERIGCGSFGEVWRARAPGGVEVAVKVLLRPIAHAEAQRERDALDLIKNLRHPFVLPTLAFWQRGDRLVIVMELADGSVRDRLQQCLRAGLPGIPVEELLDYVRQASAALDFLHGHEVMHRDVKPDNLLLLQHFVKLADMGLARRVEGERQITATACGSLAYMAPEVWSGRAAPASDQYSLAVTYLELRVGRLPFETHNMGELMLAHLEGTPDLGSLPAAEQEVLLRALAKDPSERFPTCRAFWEALHDAVAPPGPRGSGRYATPAGENGAGTGGSGGSSVAVLPKAATAPTPKTLVAIETRESIPVTPPPRQPSVRTRRRRRRRFLLAASLLVLAAALVGAGAAFLLSYLKPPRSVLIPPGFVAGEGAAQVAARGTFVYDRIARQLDPQDPATRVEFLLIPEAGSDDPPFYLLKYKVTNRLFRRFDEEVGAVDSPWREGGAVRGQPLRVEPDRYDWPVFHVTAVDAHRFARWLAIGAGHDWNGDLPTAREWDRACGLSASRRGLVPPGERPPPGDFALDPVGPQPVSDCPRDVARSGCRNLFSNGWEWTRSEFPSEEEVDLDRAERGLFLSLRGQSYIRAVPYSVDAEGKPSSPDTELANQAKSAIGFRMVLEFRGPGAAR